MKAKRDEVLTVLISAQQHGDEPSGKEAALALARDLIVNDHGLLEHMDLILVPQMNPDGGDAGTRRNAADRDLNRNHTILSEPEVQALHGLFLDWMPELTLDVHEINVSRSSWMESGYLRDPVQQFGGVSNINIAPKIRALSTELMIPEVGRRIEAEGLSFHEYIVGGPPAERRLRFSTTDINDSRQSMGIYDTLSFLFEGKRWTDQTAHIESRAHGQLVAMKAFLATAAANAATIKTAVRGARSALLDESTPLPPSHVRQDYGPDPERPTLHYPIFDLSTWSRRVAELDNFEPKVSPLLSVERPWAYAIPAEQTELLELLERHRISSRTRESETTVAVERYEITAIEKVEVEDNEADEIGVAVHREQIALPVGTVIVPVRQPAANLIPLLLEPQSLWGPFSERGGRHLSLASSLKVGTMFPVLRVIEPIRD
jgi:hypothetical protein